jgi:5-methylcytosine-specific restriction protein B
MSMPLRIDEFVKQCDALDGNMDFTYVNVAPSFDFSNTGRRGGKKKYFSISLIELLQTLKDIRDNISHFAMAKEYKEQEMRDFFGRHISSKTVNALSAVQTLPLYSVIAKVIHVSNRLTTKFDEKAMPVDHNMFDVAINYLETQLPDNSGYLQNLGASSLVTTGNGINKIFYGAPGSGKSYKVDQQCDDKNSIRTIFHPDTQNSDFLGCLKPKMNGTDVVYEFRAGPFTKAIVGAYNNPNSDYFLIIEEINRASAAAVFGEVFQLLDRGTDNASTYSIDVNDPDMLQYLQSNAPSSIVQGKLKIPNNLSLYATMNSSDQAVMPMDTAFKRRWIFEYVPIDFSTCPNGTLSIPIRNSANIDVEWAELAQVINSALQNKSIPEDRLLGPWFVGEAELETSDSSERTLKGKLCLYLWDDVLRHNQHNIIFDNSLKNYGQLVSFLKQSKQIFNVDIEQQLVSKASQTVANTAP